MLALLWGLLALIPTPAAGEAPKTATLVLGGDLMLGRYANGALRRSGGARPLQAVATLLRRADLALVNLETPLCTQATWKKRHPGLLPDGHWFRAEPGSARVLADAGVDAVSLANNHALDCGAEGLLETLAALERADLRAVGASGGGDPLSPTLLRAGSLRVGLLAATDRRRRGESGAVSGPRHALLPGFLLRTSLPLRVAELRGSGEVDVIVVSLHWGLEGAPSPEAHQVALAHELIDAGTTLVVGHHPHRVQPVEAYGGGLILYSLGNLVFDSRVPSARFGALAEVTLRSDSGGASVPDGLTLHVVEGGDPSRGPRLPEEQAAEDTLDRLGRASLRGFGTALQRSGTRLVWSRQATQGPVLE